MNTLNPLELPIDGVRLIEASAGTGKTHAIATLYLRLVLGVRGEAPRRVQEILVVTFTRAATEELRGRVRTRLFEALNLLVRVRGGDSTVLDPAASPADPQLRDLLTLVVGEGRTDEAIVRLRLELATIDDAAIFTIHGFCQRALQEQAFDSGEAFDVDLVQDDSLRELQAVQDHWRTRFYGSDLLAAFARARYATPENLYRKLRPLLRPGLALQYAGISPEALQQRHRALAAAWPAGRAALLAAIEGCKGLSRGPYKSPDIAAAAAEVDAWLATGTLAPPQKALSLFGRTSLDASLTATARKKGERVADTALDATVQAFLDGIPSLDHQVLAEAASDIRERLDAARRHAGAAAFDDLIGRLHHALNGSPQGARLAGALRRRYPVALIDEFQDTDPLQYGIFSRIYADADARRDAGTALMMIGDPKQAIYSFRGADIFAYMQARDDAGADRRYSLDTNWRSVRPMVSGVNTLFARRKPAFLFERAIEFHPVKAAGGADSKRLRENDAEPVPLEFWLLPPGEKDKPLTKERAKDITLAQTAHRIAALLRDGTRGGKPIKPRDIAVLVRTNAQGGEVQAVLRDVGIGSAMTATDSVFSSDEAWALRDVLAAIAEPASDRALRRALVSPLWPHDAAFIAGLAGDSAAMEALLRLLQDWRDAWLGRGFMPMFRAFLHRSGSDGGVATRLLAQPDGERRLTNLIQLGELLQQASRENPTPEALLRWFDDNIAEPDAAAEDQQLRLESDEDLVQILTLHRSKGLEYPVVFLPFLYHTIGVDPDREPPRFHDDDNRLVVDLAASEEAIARADYERLAEDLRLLYVALTRARDYCVVPWGRVNATETAALAYLLHGPDGITDVAALAAHVKKMTAASVKTELAALAASRPDEIRVVDIADAAQPLPAGTRVASETPATLAARTISRRVQRAWIATSYSGLVEGSHDDARDVGMRHELPVVATTPALTPFTLAGGTETGHLFHDLFETLDYQARDAGLLRQRVAAQLARRAMPADWCDTVSAMIESTLDAPLDDAGFTLRQLGGDRRRNEMEFWYPLRNVRADALEALLPGLGDGIEGPRLTFSPVNGLLQGFIDLVFEHDGRWYVADWKTNKLGPDASHYTRDHVARAIAHSRYDLQYTLYTLALHRHLQRALGTRYDPARHLGGVYYLFLRGMQPDDPARPGIWHVPADIARVDALDRLCGRRTP